MRIILDVMSGDHSPHEILKGAALAKREYRSLDITVVGDATVIESVMKDEGLDIPDLTVVHADTVVTMEDKSMCVIHDKKNSSMGVGLRLLADGEGDAFVSAGNTGALLTGASLIVKRMRGVSRPGIATILPFSTPLMVLDSGANLVVTDTDIELFAIMGSVYMKKIYNIPSPRVGLANNGTEPTKGLDLQLNSYKRLSENKSIRFIGNVEGKEIPFSPCEVLVTDGFTGNMILKMAEGMSRFMLRTVKSVFYTNFFTKLCGSVLRPHIKTLKKRFDATEHGGAPILGVRKPVIKAHGSSDANAIKNAIRQAMSFAKDGIGNEIEKIALEFEQKKRAEAEAAREKRVSATQKE